MKHGRRHFSQRGFSLLEMSVVIGIIALVMGFGISLGTNAIASAERISTQERLALIQDALEQYIALNGYLPCPSPRALTPYSDPTTFGMEARSGASCNTSASLILTGMAPFYIGAVPVRALGLPDSYAADAWDNKFLYAVSEKHIAGPAEYLLYPGVIDVNTGIAALGTQLLTVSSDRSQAITDSTHLMAQRGASYVVLSHGPDGRGAYPLNNTSAPIPCGAAGQNDTYNCDDSDTPFIDTAYNDGENISFYFDDYIVWGSNANRRPELRDNTDVLAGGLATGCPAGVCEAWCAPCGGDAAIAHLPTTPDQLVTDMQSGANGAKLCKKIITSATATTCTATCVWSGYFIPGHPTSPDQHVRCP